MAATQSVFVSGHRGMVGSALVRRLEGEPGVRTITAGRAECDLTRQAEVETWMDANRPDAVIVAAAKVGGILANDTYPADFIYENLMISANLIHAAYRAGVERLLFLGSSCIYPRLAPQPMPESCLLAGPLEPTNEAYAVAKIAGLKLCEYYRKQHGVLYHSAMPTNLYGPGDNYHPENSHVIPGLIRRFHEAREAGLESVTIWGTGTPRREFLHVDDLADAVWFLLGQADPPDLVNVGVGEDMAIIDLARRVAGVVGFEGQILTDPKKPDGTPRKLMDTAVLNSLGWKPKIELQVGLQEAYAAFVAQSEEGSLRG